MNDEPAEEGIYVGTYPDERKVYVGTASEPGENQPIGIYPPKPSQSILWINDTTQFIHEASGVKYLVVDCSCKCEWIKSSDGRWEDGIVAINQSAWIHFIGAIFYPNGDLKCIGPVSEDWHVMSCVDDTGNQLQGITEYNVLICNPN